MTIMKDIDNTNLVDFLVKNVKIYYMINVVVFGKVLDFK